MGSEVDAIIWPGAPRVSACLLERPRRMQAHRQLTHMTRHARGRSARRHGLRGGLCGGSGGGRIRKRVRSGCSWRDLVAICSTLVAIWRVLGRLEALVACLARERRSVAKVAAAAAGYGGGRSAPRQAGRCDLGGARCNLDGARCNLGGARCDLGGVRCDLGALCGVGRCDLGGSVGDLAHHLGNLERERHAAVAVCDRSASYRRSAPSVGRRLERRLFGGRQGQSGGQSGRQSGGWHSGGGGRGGGWHSKGGGRRGGREVWHARSKHGDAARGREAGGGAP